MNRQRLPIAWVAALGLASAATSAYWAVGGTRLLDTIGGELERWGRERGALVLVAPSSVVGPGTGLPLLVFAITALAGPMRAQAAVGEPAV